jgi:hypothetical protein
MGVCAKTCVLLGWQEVVGQGGGVGVSGLLTMSINLSGFTSRLSTSRVHTSAQHRTAWHRAGVNILCCTTHTANNSTLRLNIRNTACKLLGLHLTCVRLTRTTLQQWDSAGTAISASPAPPWKPTLTGLNSSAITPSASADVSRPNCNTQDDTPCRVQGPPLCNTAQCTAGH